LTSGRSGKPQSLPSVLGYRASPHAPHNPALLSPSPGEPTPAGAHSSSSQHPRAGARHPACYLALPRRARREPSPRAPPRAVAPAPASPLPVCPCRHAPLCWLRRTRAISPSPRRANVTAAAMRLRPDDPQWRTFVTGRVSQCFSGVPLIGPSVYNHLACLWKSRLPGQRRFHWGMPLKDAAQPAAALRPPPRGAARGDHR